MNDIIENVKDNIIENVKDNKCEIEENKINYIEIATELQYNIKAEATAITDYNMLLDLIDKSDIPSGQKLAIISAVYEIIADEMNHQDVLQNLYTSVTGISAKED